MLRMHVGDFHVYLHVFQLFCTFSASMLCFYDMLLMHLHVDVMAENVRFSYKTIGLIIGLVMLLRLSGAHIATLPRSSLCSILTWCE